MKKSFVVLGFSGSDSLPGERDWSNFLHRLLPGLGVFPVRSQRSHSSGEKGEKIVMNILIVYLHGDIKPF
jgi:hypothetical protein